MSLNDELRDSLKRLFDSVRRGRAPKRDLPEPFHEVATSPGEVWHLIGEGLDLMKRLARQLAQSGLMSGGLNPRVAEDRLIAACSLSLTEGFEAALKGLEQHLEAPLERWLVARPVVASMSDKRLEVGRCVITRGLPTVLSDGWPEHFAPDFAGHCISTSVEARDDESALLLAEQAVLEAISILRLTDWQWKGRPNLGGVVAMHSPKGFQLRTVPGQSLSATSMVRGGAFYWPHLIRLGEAARKAVGEQSEWERRTLAAARWLDEGASMGRPNDALVCFMVGLETLFLPPHTYGKGNALAAAVSSRWTVQEKSPAATEVWLKRLYERRNDAVHEGATYEDDLDISALRLLAWQATSWAATHLRPYHGRRDNKVCSSQGEALSPHYPFGAEQSP